jgi:predicted peroxiredoxin
MKIYKLLAIFILIAMVGSIAQTKITKPKAATKKAEETAQYIPPPPPPPPKDGVFIHISSGLENPHKVLMGLTMALRMADENDVYVYMDINAVNVVLNNSKSLEMNKFETSKILVDKILNKGVRIAVCPTCLEVANKTQYDLMKGIKLANKEDFFGFTQGRILTLDY